MMNNQNKMDAYLKQLNSVPVDRVPFCAELQLIALSFNVIISLEDVHTVWKKYSNTIGTQWMNNYKSESLQTSSIKEVFRTILHYEN